MQNKAKVKYPKINLTSFMISIYVQVGQLVIQTNKANKAKNKPNSNPIDSKGKIDAKHLFTESYDDKTVLCLCENKANSNPIQTQ
jgi:hypothetical protein